MKFKICPDYVQRFIRFESSLSELNEFMVDEVELEISTFDSIHNRKKSALEPWISLMDQLIDIMGIHSNIRIGYNELRDKVWDEEEIMKKLTGEYVDADIPVSQRHDDWDYLVEHKMIFIVKTPEQALVDFILEESEFPLSILYDSRSKDEYEALLKNMPIASVHSSEGPVYDLNGLENGYLNLVNDTITMVKELEKLRDCFNFIAGEQRHYYEKVGPQKVKRIK